MHIEKQFQIPLVKIELSPSPTPDQVLSALQQKIEENPDVSVISLSHTTYQTGTVLPIKAIRQLLNTM
jgi:selenocysteine lyase/cysteine desulfurase